MIVLANKISNESGSGVMVLKDNDKGRSEEIIYTSPSKKELGLAE